MSTTTLIITIVVILFIIVPIVFFVLFGVAGIAMTKAVIDIKDQPLISNANRAASNARQAARNAAMLDQFNQRATAMSNSQNRMIADFRQI